MSERAWVPPNPVDTQFLTGAGRALMGWWQSQARPSGRGVVLPSEAERYRAWWAPTFRSLESGWAGPGISRGESLLEELQHYADEARRWYAEHGAEGPPPPVFLDTVPLAETVADTLSPFTRALLASAAVAGFAWLLSRRK